MPERFTGYALVVVGIVLILYSCYSVITVFTGATQPINLFNFNGITLNPSMLLGGSAPGQLLSELTNSQSGAGQSPLISAEMINKPMNIFAELLLMGFILNVGFKLASLGVQLIRPMVVKVKSEEPAK